LRFPAHYLRISCIDIRLFDGHTDDRTGMNHRIRKTALTTGLAAAMLAGPLGVAANAAATATITLNGTSATFSGSNVTVSGGAVTITAPGSYEISGTLTNGSVTVNSTATGTVELILNGASITSSTTAPVNVTAATQVTVTLNAGTTNSLTDAANHSTDTAGEPDGALFSKSNLTIGGTGSLNVRANFADGIVSKDDLVVQSGTITVNSVDDGLRGTESVTINGGTVNVTSSGGDGIKSSSATVGSGVTSITSGTVTVSAADDGIKGERVLNISGGTVNVTKSYEALEAIQLTVSGGATSVVASDDAVNASEDGYDGETVAPDAFIKVTGGTLAANGGTDALDSNGALTLAGGTVSAAGSATIGGGEGAIDANGVIAFTGGTVGASAVTSLAVFKTVPNTGQGWVAPKFSTTYAAGTIVHIVSGTTVLGSYQGPKAFKEAFFSSSKITTGQSYDVYVGGSVSGTAVGGVYTAGSISGATKVTTAVAGQYSRS
jgi:hypothetical protein